MFERIKQKIRQFFYVCPCECKKELNIPCEFARMECYLDCFSKRIRDKFK